MRTMRDPRQPTARRTPISWSARDGHDHRVHDPDCPDPDGEERDREVDRVQDLEPLVDLAVIGGTLDRNQLREVTLDRLGDGVRIGSVGGDDVYGGDDPLLARSAGQSPVERSLRVLPELAGGVKPDDPECSPVEGDRLAH